MMRMSSGVIRDFYRAGVRSSSAFVKRFLDFYFYFFKEIVKGKKQRTGSSR
jgi:hypothetical protein